MLGDLHLAGKDQGHAGAGLADGQHRLALGIGARLGKAAQAIDLVRFQAGERLIGAGVQEVSGGGAHRIRRRRSAAWTWPYSCGQDS